MKIFFKILFYTVYWIPAMIAVTLFAILMNDEKTIKEIFRG